MTKINDKRYLSDGVYAQWDGLHVILTVEDGRRTTNTVYINEDVWTALVDYIDFLKEIDCIRCVLDHGRP